MKRQRIFRGKDINTGVWVHGAVSQGDDGLYRINTASFDAPAIHIIDHNTIGEAVGCNDKNGKPIYEDDIARVKYEGKTRVGLIQYDALGVFIFVARGFGWIPLFQISDDEDACIRHKIGGIEIIGNIHDNPELLEAAQ